MQALSEINVWLLFRGDPGLFILLKWTRLDSTLIGGYISLHENTSIDTPALRVNLAVLTNEALHSLSWSTRVTEKVLFLDTLYDPSCSIFMSMTCFSGFRSVFYLKNIQGLTWYLEWQWRRGETGWIWLLHISDFLSGGNKGSEALRRMRTKNCVKLKLIRARSAVAV